MQTKKSFEKSLTEDFKRWGTFLNNLTKISICPWQKMTDKQFIYKNKLTRLFVPSKTCIFRLKVYGWKFKKKKFV